MKRFLIGVVWCSCCIAVTAQPRKKSAAELSDIHMIGKFLGAFPCENGLINSPALRSVLKRALDTDYREYENFSSLAGCGRLEMRDQYVFADISQLHVGGYTSYIFVRPRDGTTYVFWLNSTVSEKHWTLYGPKPVPDIVLQTVGAELNGAWGHVANFQFVGQNLQIHLNKQ